MHSSLHRVSRLVLVGIPFLFGCRQHTTHESPRLPIDGVRFVAHARLLTPDDSLLEVRVRAVNTGRAIRTVEFGNCSMNVGVSTVGPTTARQWEYVVWAKAQRPPIPCLSYQATRDLAPGDSVSPTDFMRRIPVHAILGDSLPPGPYRVTARVTVNGRPSDNLASGELELREPARGSAVAAGGGNR